MIDVIQQLFIYDWNETTNIWRNFRLFQNIIYKRSRSKDWRTKNALALRFYEIKDNNLRLYACQVKDEQYRRSTLEVKDEQIRLSLDAWGQGLTDEQHSHYSLEAECGREMASNATWTETSNPDIDTLDFDWSALLPCVSFTCSKVQITHDAHEKIGFFAYHTFLVVDSLFEQKSNQGQTTQLPAYVCKSNVEIRIACSSCRLQLLLLLLLLLSSLLLLLLLLLLLCRIESLNLRSEQAARYDTLNFITEKWNGRTVDRHNDGIS